MEPMHAARFVPKSPEAPRRCALRAGHRVARAVVVARGDRPRSPDRVPDDRDDAREPRDDLPVLFVQGRGELRAASSPAAANGQAERRPAEGGSSVAGRSEHVMILRASCRGRRPRRSRPLGGRPHHRQRTTLRVGPSSSGPPLRAAAPPPYRFARPRRSRGDGKGDRHPPRRAGPLDHWDQGKELSATSRSRRNRFRCTSATRSARGFAGRTRTPGATSSVQCEGDRSLARTARSRPRPVCRGASTTVPRETLGFMKPSEKAR